VPGTNPCFLTKFLYNVIVEKPHAYAKDSAGRQQSLITPIKNTDYTERILYV